MINLQWIPQYDLIKVVLWFTRIKITLIEGGRYLGKSKKKIIKNDKVLQACARGLIVVQLPSRIRLGDARLLCHEVPQAGILEWVAVSTSGIFPAQGLKLHFLHWQADSLLVSHMGSSLHVTKWHFTGKFIN